jgi:aminoglycoside N3'-acetyltransferase
LTESRFREILTNELGARDGSVVFVHSAVGKMNLGFAAPRVLDILQEVVGTEGTLLFPCTHLAERAEEYLKRNESFDVRKSATTMGILAELARRQPGAVRSLHPTSSVVAIGKHAEELTATHPDSVYPCGRQSPYYKIVHHDGIIVGLGVPPEKSLSFVHCVEDIMKDRFPVETRTREVFQARVVDQHGRERIVPTLAAHWRIQRRNIARYFRRYVPPETCRNLVIDGVSYYTAKSRQLYARMEELANRSITIYSGCILW